MFNLNVMSNKEAEFIGVKLNLSNLEEDVAKDTTMRPYEFLHELEDGLKALEAIQGLDKTEDIGDNRFNKFTDENYVNSTDDKIAEGNIKGNMTEMEYWLLSKQENKEIHENISQTFDVNTGEIYSNPLHNLMSQKQNENAFTVTPAYNQQQADTAEYFRRQYLEDQFTKQTQMEKTIQQNGGLDNPNVDEDISKYLIQRSNDREAYQSQADQLARELQNQQMIIDEQEANYSVNNMKNDMVNSAIGGSVQSPYTIDESCIKAAWARICLEYKVPPELQVYKEETTYAYCRENNIDLVAFARGMFNI